MKAGQMNIPDHEECNIFHQAFIEFLDNSTEIVSAYDVITTHIESHNPATEADLLEVDATLNALLENDGALFGGVTDAQKGMAEKFGYELE